MDKKIDSMKAEYINPFIESVRELFSTMLNSNAERGDVDVYWEVPPSSDIVALIGLSGPMRGTVALSFPVGTALSLVGRMLGVDVRVVDDTVRDGIAEVVNIVAGSAKGKLHKGMGGPIDLSLPTVVRGTDYQVGYPSRTAWLEVPFTSDLGAFSLRVTFETPDDTGGASNESSDS
ncbi:chemotaxis protein CheX [bacterium]|nr:chemotaxis protein CheX [bacterium]